MSLIGNLHFARSRGAAPYCEGAIGGVISATLLTLFVLPALKKWKNR